MAAGTAYAKRYAGGFADGSAGGTPIDSSFLNPVETALLQLLGAAPTADGQVAQWDFANTRFGPALLLNKNIDPAAAIAKSKLDFTGANGIVNADVAGAAAIARSKLNFGSGLVDGDIAAGAAIATSKIAGYLPGPTLLRKTTAKTVNTTVAATDLLNGEITIPILSSSSVVRLQAWGDFMNNSGGVVVGPRWQVVFGGTTLLDTNVNPATEPTNATRWNWRVDVTIQNAGATNAQTSNLLIWRATALSGLSGTGTAAFTVGEGARCLAFGGFEAITGIGTPGAVDTTATRALLLNVINGSASATYETKLLGALVEIF